MTNSNEKIAEQTLQLQLDLLELKRLEHREACVANWLERARIIRPHIHSSLAEVKVVSCWRALKIMAEGVLKGYCKMSSLWKEIREEKSNLESGEPTHYEQQ